MEKIEWLLVFAVGGRGCRVAYCGLGDIIGTVASPYNR
jgi:hypothetical protein